MALSLLDTDTLSEVLKQKDPIVVRRASDYLQQHQQFAFSSITRYEVVRGLKAKRATNTGERSSPATPPISPGFQDSSLRTGGSRNAEGGQRQGKERPDPRNEGPTFWPDAKPLAV